MWRHRQRHTISCDVTTGTLTDQVTHGVSVWKSPFWSSLICSLCHMRIKILYELLQRIEHALLVWCNDVSLAVITSIWIWGVVINWRMNQPHLHNFLDIVTLVLKPSYGCMDMRICSSLITHDDVINSKYFPHYWSFVRPRTKLSGAELWCFLWSAPEEAVE